jgi:hypothetical protein
MTNNIKKVVGLQIGGTVGPDDKVGMHVTMPAQPGVSVSINPNVTKINNELDNINKNISNNEPNAKEVREIVREILEEQDETKKLEKIKKLVNIGKGITSIATSILTIKQMLGL